MSHYDVIGVAETATHAEVRAAYLRLARTNHPDRLSDRSAEEQRRAADRMAAINEAWAVLSDPRRRAAYDAERTGATSGSGARIADQQSHFVPFDDGDDWVDPRLVDDSITGRTVVSRRVTMLPAVLAASGAVMIVLGALLGILPLFYAGFGAVVASGLAFLFVPVIAMVNSSRGDPDGRR